MRPTLYLSSLLLTLGLLASSAVCAQANTGAASGAAAAPAAVPAPDPARTLLVNKCFQCHNDAIWRDQRQGTRAWEATLYRMVGRGALWSGEDIKTMATLLAVDYGSDVPRAKSTPRP